MECSNGEKIDLLIKTLKNYLKARGKAIYSLAEAAGQEQVSIELQALYWYYPRTSTYRRFMDMYTSLTSSGECEVSIYGDKIVLKKDRIVLPRRLVKVLMNE